MSITNRATVTLAFLALTVAACDRVPSATDEPAPAPTSSGGPATPADGAPAAGGGRPLLQPEPTPGVHFRIREAEPGAAQDVAGPRTVAGEPLPSADVAAHLARLPDLPVTEALTTTFALRPGPKPPAITGESRRQPWPPPAAEAPPPEAPTGPLSVTRAGPEGDTPMAARLAVTFSDPMVPLTSHAALDELDLPISLSPQVEGQWRWVGTKTLLFEPEFRFPQATDYEVEVPAGTQSVNGAELGSAYSWTFRTPPARLTGFWPGWPPGASEPPTTDRDPVLVATFDQEVDASAVLGVTQAVAGETAVDLRLATDAEIEEDERARSVRDRTMEGRWVAFRSVDELPLGTRVTVTIGPELPSAEGPRTSGEESWTYVFQVYGPLRVQGLDCERPHQPDPTLGPYPWTDNPPTTIDRCYPGEDWAIVFTNPLEADGFEELEFSIRPEIPGITFQPEGRTVDVDALSEGHTEYVITVPGRVTDIYGQTLGDQVDVTFITAEARPLLAVPGEGMLVLDPSAEGVLDVVALNIGLEVQLYRVEPRHWSAYAEFLEEWRDWVWGNQRFTKAEPVPPGELVFDEEITDTGAQDALTLVDVDLAPALTAGFGQVIAVIKPTSWREDLDAGVWPQVRWVQVTHLGLSYQADAELHQVWVTDLKSGSPLEGVEVRSEAAPSGQETDTDGLATFALTGDTDIGQIVAERGGDLALVPVGWSYDNYYSGGMYDPADPMRLLSCIFDDRGIYRPGEEVHVKGWVRPVDWSTRGDLQPADPELRLIDYRFSAPNGEELAAGTVTVSGAGGFDEVLTLPADVELGSAQLTMTPRGSWSDWQLGHTIEIAEFRRPEYDVVAQAQEPYYFFGDTGYVEASASYFAGGALPGAEVLWNVTGAPTDYSPPGHPSFVFGQWRPWWYGPWYSSSHGSDSSHESLDGLTDAEGKHRLAIDLEGVVPRSAASIMAEATVMDVNRQGWSAEASFIVHPAGEYVGLRLDRWFADPGDALEIEAIVADLEGELVLGREIALSAERLEWSFRAGEYEESTVPAGECSVQSEARPVTCEFEFDEGGRYQLTAEITDSAGRANVTTVTLWVSGGDAAPTGQRAEGDRVELVPDASEYQPGDTAEILVQAPFAPAEGLMTVRRSGLVSTERFRMADGSHTLSIPITELEMPNVTVHVDLVGAQPRRGSDGRLDPDLPQAPAFAAGSIELEVPPLVRTLSVSAEPRDAEIEPGASTEIDIIVADAEGEPVAGAEVALVVADEAILALTDYQIPDPIESFYPSRPAGVSDGRSHHYLWLSDPATLASGVRALSSSIGLPPAPATGGGGGGMAETKHWMAYSEAEFAEEAAMPGLAMARGAGRDEMAVQEGRAPPVRLRTNLNPLAHFAPALVTDGGGRVSASVELPDNATRYRITAVATDGGTRFGDGESSLTAALPLAVRPSAPRFLNFGDEFELPIVVQNQTDAALETDVVVRAANLVLTEGAPGAGRRVSVPANDRIEIRFPAAAAMPGTVVFQAAAFSGDYADAQLVDLPTWTPATTEAFATYGEIDEGVVVQPVQRPPDVVEEFGGLETTITSTALGNLTDAYLYLESYPFESSEAIASRLVATVALKEVLAVFDPEDQPHPAEVDAAIQRDLAKLGALQNYDGGFGWWSRTMPDCGSDPFLTTHVTHALARASAAGYPPSSETIARATGYLRDIDSHLNACLYLGEGRDTTKAYALFTRALLGEPNPEQAAQLLALPGERAVEALGWLLQVLHGTSGYDEARAEILRQLGNRASEEAATAQFTVQYEEGQGHVVLASDRRADAVALEALIVVTPEDSLIPKLARGLLDRRVKGRWASTQENGWVLLALERYFRTYERQDPDFVARTWLGDGFVGEAEFRGRSADRLETTVPLTYLSSEPADITVAKDGVGRLYYRLGLRYAPDDLALEPLERGFSVSREYDWVDDPDDVKRLADGTYEVRAGARVRVRLAMVADTRRYHVALVDPLPAGLEALNPELAVTGDIPPDVQREEVGGGPAIYRWWWPWPWYEHQAFRDERTEAFTNLLYPGVYSFTYVARATTPGTFVVPPTKAEELYHPETFGRGGTDRVVVK